MGFESTITEQDLDAASQQFIRGVRRDREESEPGAGVDLAVDGLTESLMSRIVGLLTFGRS